MRIKNTKDQNFVVVKDKQILNFGNIKVEVFRTTSAHLNICLCFPYRRRNYCLCWGLYY